MSANWGIEITTGERELVLFLSVHTKSGKSRDDVFGMQDLITC